MDESNKPQEFEEDPREKARLEKLNRLQEIEKEKSERQKQKIEAQREAAEQSRQFQIEKLKFRQENEQV